MGFGTPTSYVWFSSSKFKKKSWGKKHVILRHTHIQRDCKNENYVARTQKKKSPDSKRCCLFPVNQFWKKYTSSTTSKQQQPQHACESLPQKTPLAFFHQDFQKKRQRWKHPGTFHPKTSPPSWCAKSMHAPLKWKDVVLELHYLAACPTCNTPSVSKALATQVEITLGRAPTETTCKRVELEVLPMQLKLPHTFFKGNQRRLKPLNVGVFFCNSEVTLVIW